ncbi:MAG: helix-turn-helix domain-containing protein, partial [Pseudomonadota bacterium]
MTKPLSLDLRQRVIAAIEAGLSCRAAATRFGIAPSAAVKWHRRWRDTGSVVPK